MSSTPAPPPRQRATSFSEVSTANKTRALVYLLNSIDSITFVQRLLDAAKPENGYTPEEIEGLTDALKGVGFERVLAQAERAVADDTLRHCVRCHHSYLERENKNDACVIRHAYPFSMASVPLSGDAHHQCLSCEKLVPTASVVDQVCVATRHTTNAANLSAVRTSNLIRTCEEVGCNKPVVAKKVGGGRPRVKLPVQFNLSSTPTKPVATPPKGPESWTLVASSSTSTNSSVGSEATEDSNASDLKRKPSKENIRTGETTSTSTISSSSNSKAQPAVDSESKGTPITIAKNTGAFQAPPATNGGAERSTNTTGTVVPPPSASSTTKAATAPSANTTGTIAPPSSAPSTTKAATAPSTNATTTTFASLASSASTTKGAAAQSSNAAGTAFAPFASSASLPSSGLLKFSFGTGPLSTALPKAPAPVPPSPFGSGNKNSSVFSDGFGKAPAQRVGGKADSAS